MVNLRTVLLQLRPQRHHLHRPSRSLPHTRTRLRSRRQRRRRQARRYSLRPALQLPQRTGDAGSCKRPVDLFRLQYPRRYNHVLYDTRDEVERCRRDGLRGVVCGQCC